MCVSVCVSFHKGEIHYSDNESIWDNMRQFTSPVIVSSICGGRFSSSEPEDIEQRRSLVSMLADGRRFPSKSAAERPLAVISRAEQRCFLVEASSEKQEVKNQPGSLRRLNQAPTGTSGGASPSP